jgi:hypothetical protein
MGEARRGEEPGLEPPPVEQRDSQPWSRCQLAGRQVEEGRIERCDESGSAAGATAPVKVGVKEGEREGVKHERAARGQERTVDCMQACDTTAGGFAGKSWRVKGERNWEGKSSWKSGGDEHVFIAG